eukprot:SAG31_NODE_32983_length_349_cov_0.984000_1_plen_39_part_10
MSVRTTASALSEDGCVQLLAMNETMVMPAADAEAAATVT